MGTFLAPSQPWALAMHTKEFSTILKGTRYNFRKYLKLAQ